MLSQIFIDRPKLAIVIAIVTMLAGAMCIFKVPVAEYPEIAPPQIMVTASYPGASAEVIADTVAAVIESQVNGIEDMIYFSSTSDNSGNYQLSITFEPGTDTDIAQVNVQNAIQRAEPTLPAEVKALGVQTMKRSTDILGMYVFTTDGSTLSLLELSNYVKINVRDVLARINGISDCEIFGERSYSMRIWLDPMKMSALKLTPEIIISKLASQNIPAATGSLGGEKANPYLQLKLDVTGRLRTPEEFDHIVVATGAHGEQVLLGDIARLELGAERYSDEGFYNGESCIAMAIYRQDGANAVELVKNANALLDELRKPYVTTARAKGVRPLKLLFKYPVRIALNPFISGIGTLFPALVSGSSIVAIVMSLPTVGPMMLSALFSQDMNMAGSMLMVLSLLGVFGTLVSDLLLMLVDPRIRLEGGKTR